MQVQEIERLRPVAAFQVLIFIRQLGDRATWTKWLSHPFHIHTHLHVAMLLLQPVYII